MRRVRELAPHVRDIESRALPRFLRLSRHNKSHPKSLCQLCGGGVMLMDQQEPSIIDKKISRPALRYHGGKWRLSPFIIDLLPAHYRYVENAVNLSDDPIEDARRFIILSAMGFSSDAATRSGRSGFRCHRDAVATFAKGFDHLMLISGLKGAA